jgi:hypothetical protein
MAAGGMNPPQTLQGKLTYAGILISAIGAIGRMFGLHLPTTEAQGMVDLVAAKWDTLAQFGGLATAAYGRLRINWRKP